MPPLRIAVVQAALRSDGSEDPRAALIRAEARLRSATEHRNSVLRQAQAVALLDQLFMDEQHTLAEQFTRPLADRVSGYLQCIFGVGAQAQVELQNNEFARLRLYRPDFGGAAFAFDMLDSPRRSAPQVVRALGHGALAALNLIGLLTEVAADHAGRCEPFRRECGRVPVGERVRAYVVLYMTYPILASKAPSIAHFAENNQLFFQAPRLTIALCHGHCSPQTVGRDRLPLRMSRPGPVPLCASFLASSSPLDRRPRKRGMPPFQFDVLLAVACDFTIRICRQGRLDAGERPLFPRGGRVRSDVIIQASLCSRLAGDTVPVRLAVSAPAKPVY